MMLDLFQQVILLLTFLATQKVNALDCDAGWFGEGCKYKCQCAGASPCGINGVCPGGRCIQFYFGPSCQFLDMFMVAPSYSTVSFLRDNNDATCNYNSIATSAEMILSEPWPFVWFRVLVNDQRNILNFTTTLDGTKSCDNERKFHDNNFVDVTCDIDFLVSKLRIEGPIAPDICSIYISGGRNVALRQSASQSSNKTVDPLMGLASFAVDGNTNFNYEYFSCTHTNAETKPEWRLSYNRPQILLTTVITNRNVQQLRLQGFKLEMLSETGSRNYFFTDNNTATQYRYELKLTSRCPTSKLIIYKDTGDFVYRIMSLCEVETFGETVCPEEKYGLWCNETCTCTGNKICNPVTGICSPTSCKAGFYGFNCSSRCSNSCVDALCMPRNGKCFNCIPGYTGDVCDSACNGGFYGPGCKFTCSKHCSNVCDHVNGSCSCLGNYDGPTCTECKIGKYGDNCTEQCLVLCSGQGCKMTTGECVSCVGHRSGKFCEACGDGFYGLECSYTCSNHCSNVCDQVRGNCSCKDNYGGPTCTGCSEKRFGLTCESTCSAFCSGGICDPITGNCPNCSKGYSGLLCDESVDTTSESSSTGLYLLIVVAFAVLSLAICGSLLFCVNKENEETPATKGEADR